MQIFALKLDLWLTEGACSALKEALIRQKDTLLHLDLAFTPVGISPTEIVEVVAGLQGLKSLSLYTGSYSCSFSPRPLETPPPLELSSAVRRLSLGGALAPGLQRSLLESSKASLVEVNVGYNSELLELLHQCPLLRAVGLKFKPSEEHLTLLEKVSGLQRLTVEVYFGGSVDLKALSDFLDSRPLLPWRLSLTCQLSVIKASPAVLQRVRYLRCLLGFGCSPEHPEELTQLMDSLPNLEELHFIVAVMPVVKPCLLSKVAAAWTERTAPALRQFHVHEPHGIWDPELPELAQSLKRFLPELKFCSGRECPDKQYPYIPV